MMPPTIIEWTYDEHGNIIDLYMFKSDMEMLPTTEAEILDMAANASLAQHEANQDGEP